MTPAVALFVQVPRDVLGRKDLTPTAKLVFAEIVDRMRGKPTSWPGVRTIADSIGMTDKPVTCAIRVLERAGFLVVDRRDSGQCNIYSLPQPATEKRRTSSDGPSPANRRNKSDGPKQESAGECTTLFQREAPDILRSSAGETPTEAPEKLRRKQTRRKKQTTSSSTCTTRTSAHPALTAYFCGRWSELIGGGGSYAFDGKRDGQAIKRILEAVDNDLDRAKQVVDAYLTDDDEWIRNNGSGRGLMLLASHARLQKYVAATAPPPAPAGGSSPTGAAHPILEHALTAWRDAGDHLNALTDVARRADANEFGTWGYAIASRSQARTAAEFLAEVDARERQGAHRAG